MCFERAEISLRGKSTYDGGVLEPRERRGARMLILSLSLPRCMLDWKSEMV